MAFRFAPQGAVVSLPSTPALGGIEKFCFSSDGTGLVYSNPNYDGASLGTNRGQIKFGTWDGSTWVEGNTFYGAPPSLPAASTDYDNLFTGEILAASADLSIIAYSQRFTDDSSQKHIFRQVGSSTSARFRVDPFSGYVPEDLRLSSTGARLAVLFRNNSTSNRSIRVYKQGTVSTTGVLEGDFQNITGANFSMSGDGNLLFAGTTLKSLDGSVWQTGATFSGATASAINADGTRLVVNDGAAVKVYTLSGGTWSQTGANFSASSSLWMSPDGSRVQVGTQIYSWSGTAWDTFAALPTGGVISSSGENSGVRLDDYNLTAATLYHLQAYALLENPFPFYTPSRATAIYAGATEAKAIYYGSSLLWNVAGWEPQTLPNNLLAFYRFNDAGGGSLSLADSSDNNRTLTNTGGVSLGTGILSGAASFQSSRYLSAAIPFNTAQDWAISFWANISNLKNYFTLIGGESLGRLHIHGDASGQFYLNNGSSDVSIAAFFVAGQWDHYAFSRSGSTLSVYKNSALVNTYTLTASYTATSTLYIGRIIFTGDDFQFVGRMDALGLWSRAITESEVSQLYNSGGGLEI